MAATTGSSLALAVAAAAVTSAALALRRRAGAGRDAGRVQRKPRGASSEEASSQPAVSSVSSKALAVLKLCRSLSDAQTQEVAFELLSTQLPAALGCSHVVVLAVDQAAQTWQQVVPHVEGLSGSLAGLQLPKSKFQVVPDAHADTGIRGLLAPYRTASAVLAHLTYSHAHDVAYWVLALHDTPSSWPSELDSSLMTDVVGVARSSLSRMHAATHQSHKISRMQVLLDLVRRLDQEIQQDRAVATIIDMAYQMLNAERITLFVVMPKRQELLVLESQELQGERIPISAGLAGKVATTGELILIADASAEREFDRSWDRRTGRATSSVLCAPVVDQYGEVVAVLQAVNKVCYPNVFNDEDAQMLQYLCGHAGVALHQARLFEELEQEKTATDALLQVTKLVATEGDVNELIGGIISAAYRLLSAERITLFLVDPIKQELWMAVSRDAEGIRIPIGRGIAGHVAQECCVLNIPDAYKDPRFDQSIDSKTGFHTQSVLCVPVCINGRAIAVIQAINKKYPSGGVIEFGEADEQALTMFSAEVALALRRRSIEAAFMQVLQSGKNQLERDIDVSLLAVYADTSTTARLHTNVRVSALEVTKPGTWPDHLSRRGSAADVPYCSWDFDCFKYPHQQLMVYVQSMFEEFQILQRFHVSRDKLCKFILRIRAGYNDNPFHNHFHAFSVMHAVYLMLTTTPAISFLDDLDVFCAMVAAYCHDLDHPGHTNAFEVNSMSPLALVHSDDAVLERHHAHMTFTVLADPETNLFEGLSTDDKRIARKNIITAILATDMSKHMTMVKQLGLRIAMPSTPATPLALPTSPPVMAAQRTSMRASVARSLGPRASDTRQRRSSNPSLLMDRPPAFARDKPEDRLLLLEALVHSADLSGQAFPLTVSLQWGDRIVQEFQAQAAKEADRGLPVAPFMKGLDSPLPRAKLQLSFVDNVVLPLWDHMGNLLGGLETPLNNLYAVRLLYERDVRKYEAPADEGSASGASN